MQQSLYVWEFRYYCLLKWILFQAKRPFFDWRISVLIGNKKIVFKSLDKYSNQVSLCCWRTLSRWGDYLRICTSLPEFSLDHNFDSSHELKNLPAKIKWRLAVEDETFSKHQSHHENDKNLLFALAEAISHFMYFRIDLIRPISRSAPRFLLKTVSGYSCKASFKVQWSKILWFSSIRATSVSLAHAFASRKYQKILTAVFVALCR